MPKKKQKRKASLSRRLFSGMALIILTCIVAIIVVDYNISSLFTRFQAGWQMYGIADEVNNIYINNIDNKEVLAAELNKIEKNYNVSLEVFDVSGVEDGKLLYSTRLRDKYPPQNGYYDNSEKLDYELIITGNLGDRYYQWLRDNEVSHQANDEEGLYSEYIATILKMDNGDWVKVYVELNPRDKYTQIALQYVLFLTVIMFGAAMIVTLFFARRFASPLAKVSEITKKMAGFDFSEKCPPSKTKEIATLSGSVNEMSEALDMALRDLQKKNKKLEEDIEHEHTIEHLRTGFITNVSHELKTPIAIIQGYAEGLKIFIDDDIDLAKNYCDVIMNETKGMNAMVMKLLEIIKYDSGDYKPEYEAFSIYEMFDDWFVRNEQILLDGSIKYENLIPKDALGYGDIMLLGSVVNNYLSNAVSHVSGEKLIFAGIEENEKAYRVFVYNTGEQIAAKDIDNIWVSFYRADKAMSRSEGRFGLGLAIVKSIQRLHELDCGVMNTEDGVSFWFDIKKPPEEL